MRNFISNHKIFSLIIVPSCIFIGIASIFFLIFYKGPATPAERLTVKPDYEGKLPDNYIEDSSIPETLNEHLSALLASAPYRDYKTSSTETAYFEADSKYFYSTLDPWFKNSSSVGDGICAFATAISILNYWPITPAEVAYVASSESFWDLQGSTPSNLFQNLSSYYGINYESLPVVNSNILNYYLDRKAVIIIFAKGDAPYSENGNYVIVYAARPTDDNFSIVIPTSQDLHKESDTFTRNELLSTMKDSEEFFVLSGTTTKSFPAISSTDFNIYAEL